MFFNEIAHQTPAAQLYNKFISQVFLCIKFAQILYHTFSKNDYRNYYKHQCKHLKEIME